MVYWRLGLVYVQQFDQISKDQVDQIIYQHVHEEDIAVMMPALTMRDSPQYDSRCAGSDRVKSLFAISQG